MTQFIVKTIEQKKQRKIYNILSTLQSLPKVEVTCEVTGDTVNGNNTTVITVAHQQEYVPNFRFEWSPNKEHFRVYIYVASTTYEKMNAGYCFCTISSPLAALGFGTLYSFIHKNRANNKEAAYSN